MSRLFLLMLLSSSVGFFTYFVTIPSAKPKLIIESKEIDFGEILANTKYQESVRLVNGGKRTLDILQIRKSCGCIGVSVGRRSLEPGESTELLITLRELSSSTHATYAVDILTNEESGGARIHVRAKLLWEIKLSANNHIDSIFVSAENEGPIFAAPPSLDLRVNYKTLNEVSLRIISRDSNSALKIHSFELSEEVKQHISASVLPCETVLLIRLKNEFDWISSRVNGTLTINGFEKGHRVMVPIHIW